MTFDHEAYSRVGLMALVIASFVHCGGGGGSGGNGDPIGPPGPAPSAVTITTNTDVGPRFIPASAALAVGGTVTWTNTSPPFPGRHDLVATTSNWRLGRTLDPGESFQTTISQAGLYRYECTIHPGMLGTIEVR